MLCSVSHANLQQEIPTGNRIVVEKSKRLMHVYNNQQAIITFRIALGKQANGAKTCQGDNRTPEGIYTIIEHKKKSKYYRALKISYPSNADKQRAKNKRCNPGGDIMIHGLENGYGWVGRAHRSVDWTNGCIAITNEEMDILYKMVSNGSSIEIKP
jgi:murein L,D-transpeptidase YafK